ncbi:MAG: methyl-accepting chemotaxis protein [Lachnospiraceae bacterium]|nr:methyl-accepting chemotaxis protein [Lachnospiraceae bacterium]
MESKASKKSVFDSVKTKLILIMILVAAIPLIVTTIVNYRSSTSKALTDAEEINLGQAELIESNFVDIINQNFASLSAAAESPYLRDFIKAAPEQRDTEKMVAYLKTIDEGLGDGNNTVLTPADGFQIARSKGDCVDISTRDYFIQAMKGQKHLSDVIVSKSSGTRIVVPIYPIFDEDGKTVIGVLQRNVDLSTLHEIFAEKAGDKLTVFAVDSEGNEIANSVAEIAVGSEQNFSGYKFFQESRSNDEGTMVTNEYGAKSILSYIGIDQTPWVLVVARDYKDTMSSATRSAVINVIIGIIMLIAAAVVSFLLANSFTAPIFVVNETLDSLANGHFKKIDKYVGRKDEFGDMIEETNSLIDTLSDIVGSIKSSAAHVSDSSNELAETTNQISQTADDVSNAVQDIATGATQQADEIQNATENTNRISDNIQNVTDNSERLEEAAKHMSTDSKDSAEQLEKLKTSSEQMSKAIDEIAEKIGATSKAVDNINNKVEAINSIASQTNLLALNASIEAARAGDAGRGFAVVAEEIGQLSDDSARSANDIKAEMNILLEESQGAVKMAEEVRKVTEEQKEILENTVKSVNDLIGEINTTIEGIQEITSSAVACDSSKVVVVDAMDSLSAISEENAASTEETSASMQELNATVNTLASAADTLKEISSDLLKEINFFQD